MPDKYDKELAKRGINTYKELEDSYKTLHRDYVAEQLRQEGALNWGPRIAKYLHTMISPFSFRRSRR